MKCVLELNFYCYETVEESIKRTTLAAEMAAARVVGSFALEAAKENSKFYNSRAGGLYGFENDGFGWLSADGSFISVKRDRYKVVIQSEGARSVCAWWFLPKELPAECKLQVKEFNSSMVEMPWIDGNGIDHLPIWSEKFGRTIPADCTM